MSERSRHIPLALLWAYSQHADQLDSTYLHHLISCEDCVAILLLGRTSDSIEDFENRLSKYIMVQWRIEAGGGRLDMNDQHSPHS
jgi:hypothetical protein